jgi:hypothetical protein
MIKVLSVFVLERERLRKREIKNGQFQNVKTYQVVLKLKMEITLKNKV